MDNLKDFNAEEIFELSQERGGIVLYTGSRHLSMFEVLLELQELQVLKIIGIVILIISILGCFFGYKLTKIFMAICGFIVGIFVGVIVSVAGIVIAIIAVLFTKPMIIITTSVSWGKIAGLFLAVLLKNEMMSNILPWIFIAAGIFVQIKTNGGLGGLMEGIGKKAGDQVEYEKFMK